MFQTGVFRCRRVCTYTDTGFSQGSTYELFAVVTLYLRPHVPDTFLYPSLHCRQWFSPYDVQFVQEM
ncbi:hypothetical protein DPMN_150635 [Dreissena polymorpha]|uniref:Uncharacterized protein n=1 Tax=Dreissena polymorpha TaxID=45954 RepID=A0A9D4J3I5_DREPO|nr:hypothetical protein DPMN_150635 [Dreissena polymorpha]